MLVPLSRNPFPPGEKIVSRGKEYICQRCNAEEKSADVRGPKLESKFRNLTRLKCLTWGNLQYSPVHTMQNFVCFVKKSLNRKPFLVRMIFFAHQNFKVRWQNPLFLDSYPSLGHLILWTLPMNYFSFNWCFWSHKKFHVCVLSADKVSQKQKNWLSTKFSNSVQAPNYIFCHSVNRAYASSLLSSLQITPHFCSRPMLN